jgi:hypothetical protein
MIISLLTPTRNRALKCKRYLASALDLADDSTRVELLFYVDEDDPQMPDYLKMKEDIRVPSLKLDVIVGHQITVSKAWNLLASKAQGDVLCMGNDDLIYDRLGWDTALERAVTPIKHGIWCAWFNDGGANSFQWPTFPMISRAYYETLGYFAPDVGFKFFYNDTWVGEVSKHANCQKPILEPQYLAHLHHTLYPSEHDATTDWARRDGAADHDTRLFQDTVHIRKTDARKLRDAIAKRGGV